TTFSPVCISFPSYDRNSNNWDYKIGKG
uniref:Uncharacterized protein n=1 Tax=Solanum lycopersicum TaxID=4081 RepID=A0A3Q7JK08_SOLLC